MYRPSFYNKHNVSLKKFADLFNNEKHYPMIKIVPIEEETYRDDGVIINQETKQDIGFDWEIRDRYFKNCNFVLPTLRQFERKIMKPEIDISIQCDSTETGIIVAWHEDFKRNPSFTQPSITDHGNKELASVRETKHFHVYSYKDMTEFKKMISRAFVNKEYNHRSF